MPTKQIYIPSLRVKGTYIEEIGGEADRVMYPGKEINVELTEADFETEDDYHNAWIIITKAVKKKLNNDKSA